MSTDNSLLLPPENVLYVKSTPFMLFRRSWMAGNRADICRRFEPITLPAGQCTSKAVAAVEQTADEVKLVPEIVGWTKDGKTAPRNYNLYCLIETDSNGLDLRDLAKLNNCPVVSYTGYVPECEGTVVVVELLD